MAEKEQAQGDEAGKKGKLKTILFVSVAVILAAALSVGATLFFLGMGDEEADGQASSGVAEEDAGDQKKPALYMRFNKPFIVTLDANGRQRYMQISLALMGRDQAVEGAFEVHHPLLRSRLLTLMGEQDFLAMQTNEGKRQLQADALALVNSILEQEGAPGVEKVLFTNFVLQ